MGRLALVLLVFGLSAWAPPARAVEPSHPEMKLPDVQGKLQSLKKWRGKVIVLSFWATWLVPGFDRRSTLARPLGVDIRSRSVMQVASLPG